MKKFIGIIGIVFLISIASFGQTAKEWNKQGLEHFKKLEYKQAFECFSKAIEQDSKFGEAYYNRANTWFQLPANAYPNMDGCDDLKTAKSLGFKVTAAKLKEFGCE
jgi:tetratricopeptide (TPR) repeat protein